MLNEITIMGRLTKDPELRRTGSGVAVASFTIANERDFKNGEGKRETDFFDIVAWRQLGEFIARNFKKGSMIIVSGRLQRRSWADKDGYTRWTTEIVAGNAYFGEAKKNDSDGYVPPLQPSDEEYERLDDDAPLPF